jgi:hypothetical protein
MGGRRRARRLRRWLVLCYLHVEPRIANPRLRTVTSSSAIVQLEGNVCQLPKVLGDPKNARYTFSFRVTRRLINAVVDLIDEA